MSHLSKWGSACLAAALALASVAPAGAISNGTIDDPNNPRYPYVGTFALHASGATGVSVGWYTGTMIAPDVLLTWGGVARVIRWYKDTGWIDQAWVVLSPLITTLPYPYPYDQWPPAGTPAIELDLDRIYIRPATVAFPGGSLQTDPPNVGHMSENFGDIGLIGLKQNYEGPLPELPSAGMLDDLSARNGLGDAIFGIAGYGGDFVFDPGQGPYATYPWSDRRFATSSYMASGPEFLFLHMNEHQGNGGICAGFSGGDSGGPAIMTQCGSDGACKDVIFGMALYSDTRCRARGEYLRLDTPSVREFLSPHVTLP